MVELPIHYWLLANYYIFHIKSLLQIFYILFYFKTGLTVYPWLPRNSYVKQTGLELMAATYTVTSVVEFPPPNIM